MTVGVVLEGELLPVPLRHPLEQDQGRVVGEVSALVIEDLPGEAS
jgi:hypothetical protein